MTLFPKTLLSTILSSTSQKQCHFIQLYFRPYWPARNKYQICFNNTVKKNYFKMHWNISAIPSNDLVMFFSKFKYNIPGNRAPFVEAVAFWWSSFGCTSFHWNKPPFFHTLHADNYITVKNNTVVNCFDNFMFYVLSKMTFECTKTLL